jgi:hypothetical protein
MGVADGHGERVGGVVRPGRFRESEQCADHRLHLPLLRGAVPGDGLLDLERGVFAYRDGTLRQRQEQGAACLPDRQGGVQIVP